MRLFCFSLLSLFTLSSEVFAASADENRNFDDNTESSSQTLTQCLQSTVISADGTMTVSELKQACQLLDEQQYSTDPNTETQTNLSLSDATPANETPDQQSRTNNADTQLLKRRMTMEALNRSNRFMLTPHKRNYFLPISYNDEPNSEPYATAENIPDGLTDLSNAEAEFQFSIKILLRENIFGDNGHLYLGYTNHALWQLYNDSDSAPFRESEHQPELILSFINDWKFFGFRNVLNEGIINHQSNGQGGLLSRSWNRIMFNSVFERGNFVFALTPWYRLPEKAQEYPGDPKGDDNPDISDYMGKFEFTGAYQHDNEILSIMIRNNLHGDNKGAIELGWSFPLKSNLRGQLKYFSGYGHSMIDYNHYQNVAGFGVIFTDLF